MPESSEDNLERHISSNSEDEKHSEHKYKNKKFLESNHKKHERKSRIEDDSTEYTKSTHKKKEGKYDRSETKRKDKASTLMNMKFQDEEDCIETDKKQEAKTPLVFNTYEEFLSTIKADEKLHLSPTPIKSDMLSQYEANKEKDRALKQEKMRLKAKEKQKKKEIDEIKQKAKVAEENLKRKTAASKIQAAYRKFILLKQLSSICKRKIAAKKIIGAMKYW